MSSKTYYTGEEIQSYVFENELYLLKATLAADHKGGFKGSYEDFAEMEPRPTIGTLIALNAASGGKK